MKYLVKTTDVYRIDTDAEATSFLESLKADSRFEVLKTSSTKKQLKVKGEIQDEWLEVSVTLGFNDAKYPENEVNIEYDM